MEVLGQPREPIRDSLAGGSLATERDQLERKDAYGARTRSTERRSTGTTTTRPDGPDARASERKTG